MGHKAYGTGGNTWVRFETRRDGAEPGAAAGIGSTSSSRVAEEKRRHTGSTSFRQHRKKKLLLHQQQRLVLSQQLCLKLDGSICMCFAYQALNKAVI